MNIRNSALRRFMTRARWLVLVLVSLVASLIALAPADKPGSADGAERDRFAPIDAARTIERVRIELEAALTARAKTARTVELVAFAHAHAIYALATGADTFIRVGSAGDRPPLPESGKDAFQFAIIPERFAGANVSPVQWDGGHNTMRVALDGVSDAWFPFLVFAELERLVRDKRSQARDAKSRDAWQLNAIPSIETACAAIAVWRPKEYAQLSVPAGPMVGAKSATEYDVLKSFPDIETLTASQRSEVVNILELCGPLQWANGDELKLRVFRLARGE